MGRCLLTLALALVGCGPVGAGVGAGNAAVNTAIAAGASAVRRAQGECFTPCSHDMVCNEETGYCERLPCDGRCEEDELCVETGVREECVAYSDLNAEQ